MLKNTDKNVLKSKIGSKPGFYKVNRKCAMNFLTNLEKETKVSILSLLCQLFHINMCFRGTFICTKNSYTRTWV